MDLASGGRHRGGRHGVAPGRDDHPRPDRQDVAAEGRELLLRHGNRPDAEVPEVWESPRTGQEGRLVAEDGSLVETEVVETKAARTHWDMLLERRTRPELEELLQERLELLRARRGDEAAKNSKKSA